MIAATEPKRKPHLRGWLPLIVAAAAFAAAVSVIVAVRADSTSDFRDYWETAKHFRQTGEITDEFGVHNYLPFFTVFMTPWSFLPLRVAIVLFTLLSLGLLGLTVVMAETLLGDGLQRRPRRATLIVIALMAAYIYSTSVLATVNLLVLFLLITVWFLVERGREWEAGVPLGLAVLVKVLPAALILFFLLKRRWRVAATAAATFVALGVGMPLLTLGPRQTLAQHETFYRAAIQEHSAYQTINADQPHKVKYNNNALPMVLRRLLTRIDANAGEPDSAFYVNLADLPRPVIWWLYVALMLALVLGSAYVTLRGPPQWPPEDIDGVYSVRTQFGLWCCLMLLASPLVWTHYFVWAYWPLALVADRAERTFRTRQRPCLWSLTALLVWLAGAALLAWPAARAAGAQLAAVLCLWLALALLTARQTRQPTVPQARST